MNYPKLTDLETDHPQVLMAVEAIREWQARKRAGETGISMILAGPNGIGKTHMATAMQWSMMFRPEDTMAWEDEATVPLDSDFRPLGRFYTAADLLVQLGPHISDDGRVLPSPVDYFVGDAPIIVIDDLGAAISMPFVKGDMQLDEIQVRLFLLIEHCMKRTKIVRDWHVGTSDVVPDPPSLVITTNKDIGG
ncbi:MAG: hypothetical protein GWO23_09095, partial [Gammaproteobacteria bacterium]|nr:hypothetical protein [Gammaproteobacteria bacterium]NIS53431.1 hypothetical protein [Phycisphaerae bacterium]